MTSQWPSLQNTLLLTALELVIAVLNSVWHKEGATLAHSMWSMESLWPVELDIGLRQAGTGRSIMEAQCATPFFWQYKQRLCPFLELVWEASFLCTNACLLPRILSSILTLGLIQSSVPICSLYCEEGRDHCRKRRQKTWPVILSVEGATRKELRPAREPGGSGSQPS